jgi:hypothetical protein
MGQQEVAAAAAAAEEGGWVGGVAELGMDNNAE